MPLDPRVKRFLDVLAATNPPSTAALTADERRQGLAQLMRFSGPQEAVGEVRELTLPGGAGAPLRARLYTPQGAAAGPLPALVYFHGGGFVAGSIDTHDAVARALANGAGCRLVSVDYRLAPEHRFPAAIDDAVAAWRHIRRDAAALGIDPARLGIAGDSAGATLAAVSCRTLIEAADRAPALQVLLCPILDYAGSSESRRTLGAGYLLDDATLEHDLANYLPTGVDAADPRVSPLRAAEFACLPPTIIHSAEYDPLRDEAREFASRLQQARVSVSHHCHAGMIHLFYAFAGVVPYARTALAELGAEVRASLA
jgi:acetyl esterase